MDRILGALLLIGGGMLTLGLEYLPGLLNRESPPMEPVYSMPESVEPVFVTNQSTPVAGFSPLENKPESAFAMPAVQAESHTGTETENTIQEVEATKRRRLWRR